MRLVGFGEVGGSGRLRHEEINEQRGGYSEDQETGCGNDYCLTHSRQALAPPILLGLARDRRRLRVFDLHPMWRAPRLDDPQPGASTLTQGHNGHRYRAAIRVMQKMEPRERPPAPPPNVRQACLITHLGSDPADQRLRPYLKARLANGNALVLLCHLD